MTSASSLPPSQYTYPVCPDQPSGPWTFGLEKLVQGVGYLSRPYYWAWGIIEGSQMVPAADPAAWPLAGSLLKLLLAEKDIIRLYGGLSREAENTVKVARMCLGPLRQYLVGDPQVAKVVLNDSEHFLRAESFRAWRWFSPGGLAEGEEGKRRRSAAFKALGRHRMSEYYPGMAKMAKMWALHLGACADSGQSVDLMEESARATLSTTGAFFFSRDFTDETANPFSFGPKKDSMALAFITSFREIFRLIAGRMTSIIDNLPLVGEPAFDWLFSGLTTELNRHKEGIGDIIKPVLEDLVGSGDYLQVDHLKGIYSVFVSDPTQVNYDRLVEELVGVLQASFETSSKSVHWTLFHLARDPDLQDAVREELMEVLGDGEIDEEDLERCVTLRRVLEESLRLFPPVPFFTRDVKESCSVGGYTFEGGSKVLVSQLLMARDPAVWGADAEVFRADRWTDEMLTDKWQLNNPQYATFNLGTKHRCPGRHFAKQEILLFLCELLRRFAIRLEDPDAADKVRFRWAATLDSQEPIKVKLCRLVNPKGAFDD